MLKLLVDDQWMTVEAKAHAGILLRSTDRPAGFEVTVVNPSPSFERAFNRASSGRTAHKLQITGPAPFECLARCVEIFAYPDGQAKLEFAAA